MRPDNVKSNASEESLDKNNTNNWDDKPANRLPRIKDTGYLIEMDASNGFIVGDLNCTLHLALDDATSIVVEAYLDLQETKKGYYEATKQMLMNYGTSKRILTDNRQVFTNNRDGVNDGRVNYAFAMDCLNVKISTTSIPTNKARIERLNGTIQRRFKVDLNKHKPETLEEANMLLQEYIKKHNEKFSRKESGNNVWGPKLSEGYCNNCLSIFEDRKITKGGTFSYKNVQYFPTIQSKVVRNFAVGTEVLVLKTLDDKIKATIDRKLYDVIDVEKTSIDLDSFSNPRNIDFDKEKFASKQQVKEKRKVLGSTRIFLLFTKSYKHYNLFSN